MHNWSVSAATDIFDVCLFVLNYQVSVFKPILHIHETMLLHESLTRLEMHPTVSGKDALSHGHFQHHTEFQQLYERKHTKPAYQSPTITATAA